MSSQKKSFKDLSAELEEVLNWFESDEIDLDKAVEQYEKGAKLIAEIEKRIAAAEAKITKLSS